MPNVEGGFRIAPDRAVSSHDQIARVLGTEILSGVYQPGSNMPNEADLLSRFAVSRTVLREVMKTLAAKGLIAAKTRVGTRVLDPVHWTLFDADVLSWKVAHGLDDEFRRELLEMRRLVEPRAAALAAEIRDPEAIRRLRQCIERMRSPGHTPLSFAEADLKFHLTVGLASGNSLMRSLAGVIEAALIASFTLSSPTESRERQDENVDMHEAIVDGIESGNPVAASNAMLSVIQAGAARVDGAARTPKKGTNDGQ